ncbi:MAG: alpha,alpha-phosphotrehalase [Corynebacterium sp.]|nr:alpha,alpha-phosphotrehalase [Corynebacterium sp.]
MDISRSVVYQIYPKSFYDTTGNGQGDLRGIIAKLDHMADLGVDVLWLNPFFRSPQRDNGYDIADYKAIDESYGTMADLEELIDEAGKRGMKLMFDMVFNHVSTEHEWFQKALAGDQYYKDFFFFKKPVNGHAPTNWESKFGGNAWEYVPELDEYYLHLFDVTQADLNWENPNVREELFKVLEFWMEKGVGGFRFDVINLISKASFEDDFEGDGRRFYTDGPRIHEFLQEMNQRTFGGKAMMTVGEMSSTTLEACYKYAGKDTNELSMVFSFHHLKVDFAGNQKWVLVPTDFMRLKDLLFTWQTTMADNDAWNALFWCCHDQPRVVSRFGTEGHYWRESATMLGGMIHFLRGTPYVYQGEELGMTNTDYTSITQFNDVESHNYYNELVAKGMLPSDALRIIQVHSRDNARTPMQWTKGTNAGFSTGTPWLAVNSNHTWINAESQYEDPKSIYNFYKALIKLRKEHDVIALGDVTPLLKDDTHIFAYQRHYEGRTLTVVANFYGYDVERPDLSQELAGAELLLGNYEKADAAASTLRPYEFQAWLS